ncbi:MAG: glycosyltransferase family 9 protein [Selenomonadaceae bacterium]|nr:glycosyltransferase family 9 protein [Selenomonadaceae bacterium]MBQ7628614.1 glycosyltransferase family 9 protein [Selenomonadaceae bacterium]
MEQGGCEKLAAIIEDAIEDLIKTKNFTFDFYQRTEDEFKRMGYRDNPIDSVIQKILILRLDAIGDFILTTPAIRAIRENFPTAYITLAVTKAVYPLAELCPYVNEIIPFDTPFTSTTIDNDNVQILLTAFEFSARNFLHRHFDACFSFLSDNTHAIMSYLSGAPIRVGLADGGLSSLFTHQIPIDHRQVAHCCEKNLHLLMTAGLQIKSANLELWYGLEEIRRAKNILKNFAANRVKVAAGIGANIPQRKYPVEKYLTAFKEIISKGASIIILGGPSEVDDAKFLEENLPAEFVKNVVKFKPNWRTTCALMSLTDIYIGNDTGTQHVAAALKKPVILVSRVAKNTENFMTNMSTEVAMFHPWQTKSIVLRPERQLGICEERHEFVGCIIYEPHCITQIEPAEIVDAYDKIFR